VILLFAQLFIVLNILFFLFNSQINHPLFAMFASDNILWLVFYTTVLAAFGGKLEQDLGATRFAAIYVCAGVVGNLGLLGIGAPEGIAMGALAPLVGLTGAIVAMKPLTFVVVEIYPVPAIVAAAFIMLVHFIGKGGIDVFPLFAGMLLGYSMKEGIEAEQARAGFARR